MLEDKYKILEIEIDPRIEKLEKNEFFLESFYLRFAILEFMLQEIIIDQEQWIKNLVKRSCLDYKTTRKKDLKGRTFGRLIHKFGKHCIDDNLISRLNSVNSFRNDVVHRLIDCPISELNERAKKKALECLSLESGLARYHIKFKEKIIRKIRRKSK